MAISAHLEIDDLHRHSLESYHRLIEAGGFGEDERVELLDGLLVEMSPKSPAHEAAIRWLADWLYDEVDRTRFEIGIGNPLTLATSEPEPDLVVFERTTPQPYHPATAALVIEVSVSSLARDLGVKAVLYAAAGIPEYWVLDIDGGRLVAHRGPVASGYRERREHRRGEPVSSAALALPELTLDELLAG